MKKFFTFIAAVLFAGSMFAEEPEPVVKSVVLDFTDSVWNFAKDYDKTEKTYINGSDTLYHAQCNFQFCQFLNDNFFNFIHRRALAAADSKMKDTGT